MSQEKENFDLIKKLAEKTVLNEILQKEKSELKSNQNGKDNVVNVVIQSQLKQSDIEPVENKIKQDSDLDQLSKSQLNPRLLVTHSVLYQQQPSLIQQKNLEEKAEQEDENRERKDSSLLMKMFKYQESNIRTFGEKVVKLVRSSSGKIFGNRSKANMGYVCHAIEALKEPDKRQFNFDKEYILINDDSVKWSVPEWIKIDSEALVIQRFLTWSHQQHSAVLLMDEQILIKSIEEKPIFQSKYSGTSFYLAKYGSNTCLVKKINFDRKSFDNDTTWISIVKRICGNYSNNPKIPKTFAEIYEVYNWPSQSYLYVLMEILINKTLHYKIKQRKPLHINQVRLWTAQLLNGISYLQNQGIIHRNLRLEHLALDEKFNLKIIGWHRVTTFYKPFGTAHPNTIAKREKRLRRNNHFPPEAFHHNYDPRSIDVWSYGVVLCALTTFRYPFKVMDRKTCQEIRETWRTFLWRHSRSFTKFPHIEQILDRIFVLEPRKRATVAELQCSEFYQKKTAP